MNDLDAMLDQLLDGRTRLWEQLSRFTENFGQGKSHNIYRKNYVFMIHIIWNVNQLVVGKNIVEQYHVTQDTRHWKSSALSGNDNLQK